MNWMRRNVDDVVVGHVVDDRVAERLGERRLARARVVLEQDVPVGEQRDEDELDDVVAADDHRARAARRRSIAASARSRSCRQACGAKAFERIEFQVTSRSARTENHEKRVEHAEQATRPGHGARQLARTARESAAQRRDGERPDAPPKRAPTCARVSGANDGTCAARRAAKRLARLAEAARTAAPRRADRARRGTRARGARERGARTPATAGARS